MILKAIEAGVPEDRIAKALDVDVGSIRRKRILLDGICPEAVELLKDKHVPLQSFGELKKMLPVRQVEAAHLMVAMNKYSHNYARSLVGATPASELVDANKPKRVAGLSDDQIALMETGVIQAGPGVPPDRAVLRCRSPRCRRGNRVFGAPPRQCSCAPLSDTELSGTADGIPEDRRERQGGCLICPASHAGMFTGSLP